MGSSEEGIIMQNAEVQRQIDSLKQHIDDSNSSLNGQMKELSQAMTQLAITQTKATARYDNTEKEISRLAEVYNANHAEMKDMLTAYKQESQENLASHDFRISELEKDVIGLRATMKQEFVSMRGEMKNESTEIRSLVKAVETIANGNSTKTATWGSRAAGIADKIIVWGLLAFLVLITNGGS